MKRDDHTNAELINLAGTYIGQALAEKLAADGDRAIEHFNAQFTTFLEKALDDREALIHDELNDPRFTPDQRKAATALLIQLYKRLTSCDLMSGCAAVVQSGEPEDDVFDFLRHAHLHFLEMQMANAGLEQEARNVEVMKQAGLHAAARRHSPSN